MLTLQEQMQLEATAAGIRAQEEVHELYKNVPCTEVVELGGKTFTCDLKGIHGDHVQWLPSVRFSWNAESFELSPR